MFSRLVEAISLYHKGRLYGLNFFIFPADLNPLVFPNNLFNEAKLSRSNNFFPIPQKLHSLPIPEKSYVEKCDKFYRAAEY
ncbi:hypothetical protein F7734_19150 [Scytonema sp. UIC 10036]|uniref:hypothetical protein n=1 Tax=Scytonema sp. UIC 10036 TaxID=2304196 RepID=UPI0012DAD02F|nr:hypothetical protein [Scytonema sp. UIC 10036]MUG94375.1 hypothetical protein [Scytonema sp. UIC 10036]